MCTSLVHDEWAVGERVGEEMVKAEVGEEKGREVGERVGEEMVKVEVEVEGTHQVHALQSMKPRLWQWPLPLL